MNLTCNIDQRGRKARLVTGAFVDAAGIVALLAGMFLNQLAAIIAGGVLSLAGSFMIFEGAKGWCALRAMGFKTKI